MLLLIWLLYLLPATTATTLWFALGDEDEWNEVDEPSHAERPLAPFLRPRSLPPELRPTAPVGGPKLPPRWRPQHTSTRFAVTPAAVVVVATRTILADTPTFAVPAVATVAASLLSLVLFCQLFLLGSAKRQGRGPRRGLSAEP